MLVTADQLEPRPTTSRGAGRRPAEPLMVNPMRLVGLEEAFWCEELATQGSPVAHVPVKAGVAADWTRKLVDFTELRLPEMDRLGIDMQVLSLTSPGIQMQTDAKIAVADARKANDHLAAVIREHPQRFSGLAAVPLQDPPQAVAELRRAVELGLCGALVNDPCASG